MPTIRGQFGQLLAPGLYEVMFEWLKEHPEEYSQFLNVETADSAYTEDQVIAGLGLAVKKPEGTQIVYDDPIQGGSRRYIPDTYALGWVVTEEMLDDDKYSIMRKVPAELMKSHRQLWEQGGANVLNGSFSTTTTANGNALCAVSQPLLRGGTYSNRLNPDSDITQTAIQDSLVLFENMVNESGLRMRLNPTTVYINPNLQFVAAEVLQSQFKPYTGNNEVNAVQGRLEPVVLHYVTLINAWWVAADKSDHHMKFIWRKKPVAQTIDDFETKGVKHSVHCRWVAGATHWNGIVGSNP